MVMTLNADAILLATGFDLFRSERKEEYGYGIYENVITSSDLEKMFRSGEIKTEERTKARKKLELCIVWDRGTKRSVIFIVQSYAV